MKLTRPSLAVSGILDKRLLQGLIIPKVLLTHYELDILCYYQINTAFVPLTLSISSNSVSSKNLVKTFAEVLA